MHQILGLRPFFNEKKGKWDKTDNTFFKRNWRFESIPELFENLDKYLAPIPEKERINLYYTVASCTEKKREFKEQHVLAFDIDKVQAKKKDYSDYIKVICAALSIDPLKTGIVSSGNGLHFLILLEDPITEPGFFELTKRHFTFFCDKINAALKEAGLEGETDPSVYDARRILRLPGTINKKEGKEERRCVLLQKKMLPQSFSVTRDSGIPEIEAQDHINPKTLKKFSIPDTKTILDGCGFLQWCKQEPSKVSEAQWYAMLSITARLPPDGRAISHTYSEGHAGYSASETESKIDQALEASGPRTCANIDSLWNNCKNCVNFEKVSSPIMIQGEEYIKTRETGFYFMSENEKGETKKGKPDYEGLRRYFAQDTPYVVLGESGICLTWNGTHWEHFDDIKLKNFAQVNFDPTADNKMVSEFAGIVCRTNLRDTDWFTSTVTKKVNLKNGVLNLETMELTPHSMENGFRYCLPYDYDPLAKAPFFENFLIQIMKGRTDLIQVILEFFGYCLSSEDCWAHKSMIFTGEGSNGKSTLMDVLKEVAGKANYSTLTFKDINNEASRRMIDGKLFNLSEETPTYAIMESSLYKNMISGGEITVKMLYKQPYAIKNKAKIIFAANELPRTKDTSRGFFRRLLIVPFDKLFEGDNKDPFIKEKLLTELPGILNLILEGHKRLREQKRFTESKTIEAQIKAYQLELDSVQSWFKRCVTTKDVGSGIDQSLSTLYGNYKIYADEIGEKPEPESTFARRLKRILPLYQKRKGRGIIKGKREVIFKGLQCAGLAGF